MFIYFCIDRSIPRLCVYGSELNQVWTNITDNAVDAMKEQGKLWVHTAREGGYVVVEIADDGLGIPVDIQDHMNLFSQRKMSAKELVSDLILHIASSSAGIMALLTSLLFQVTPAFRSVYLSGMRTSLLSHKEDVKSDARSVF